MLPVLVCIGAFTCRPVDVKKGKKGGISRTNARFPVRSGPKQLAAYFNGQFYDVLLLNFKNCVKIDNSVTYNFTYNVQVE